MGWKNSFQPLERIPHDKKTKKFKLQKRIRLPAKSAHEMNRTRRTQAVYQALLFRFRAVSRGFALLSCFAWAFSQARFASFKTPNKRSCSKATPNRTKRIENCFYDRSTLGGGGGRQGALNFLLPVVCPFLTCAVYCRIHYHTMFGKSLSANSSPASRTPTTSYFPGSHFSTTS